MSSESQVLAEQYIQTVEDVIGYITQNGKSIPHYVIGDAGQANDLTQVVEQLKQFVACIKIKDQLVEQLETCCERIKCGCGNPDCEKCAKDAELQKLLITAKNI